MSGFENIAQGVYYLAPPIPEFGGGVTLLIIGSNKFLIDCGAFDYSVSKFLVPALKALKLDLKDIDYLLFTGCEPENMGGAHKLKQLAPNIQVMAFGYKQMERLKNPSYHFMNLWSDFLDYSPPFREIHGVLCDGTVDPENSLFSELHPIFAQGHDADCVCWFHTPSETLICGEAIQGGGSTETGIAFITSLDYYQNTIGDIIELAPQNIVCSRDYKGVPAVIRGREQCQKALKNCLDYIGEYVVFVDKHSRLVRKKRENLTPHELATAYFTNNPEPPRFGYAMHTFSEFIRPKKNSKN